MIVCIIGLPQSGKTTLYHAISGQHGQTMRPGGPDEILKAMIKVPDERLDVLAGIYSPKKVTQATIELEDVGPLFEERHGTRTVQPSTLAAVRDADGLIMVLRDFSLGLGDAEEPVDVQRDASQLHDELILADLAIIEKRLERLEKDIKRPTDHAAQDKAQYELLQVCKETLEKEEDLKSLNLSPEKLKRLSSFAFLSLKPVVCVLNAGEEPQADEAAEQKLRERFRVVTRISAQLEGEIMELPAEERDEFLKDAGIEEPAAGRIVRACYEALELRSFLTVGPDEVRAWTIRAGDDALTAAGKIHSDIARGFIRAEVVRYGELVECGSEKEAKNRGVLRLEGKEYVVEDGDVINFRFNV